MAPGATISDVARVAGVSVATVSRALRGLDKVAPATRERVLAAAAELDFVASPTASGLASGRTRLVGVVTPFLSRWFFATIIGAIDWTARSHGHHILLMDLEQTFESRVPLTNGRLLKQVDALVVVNVVLTRAEEDLIGRLGLPVVVVGGGTRRWPRVGIDDVRCGRLATDHVIELGHEEIGYVGVVPPSNHHRRTPEQRLAGFRAAMRDHGLPIRSGRVVEADWTAPGAQRAVGAMLRDDPPTAVVAGSDEMAFGVMGAAREAGLRIPEDLSVVGIDDHELASVFDLTSVRQDVVGQGRAAATFVLAQLGQACAASATAQVFPVRLIERGTTAPPP